MPPSQTFRNPWTLDEKTIYRRFCKGETIKAIAKDVKYSMRVSSAWAVGYVQKSILNQQELDSGKAEVVLRGSFGTRRIVTRR